MKLDGLADEIVDRRTKGIPGHLAAIRLGDIGLQGWNVADDDLPLPLLVLKEAALENNIELMQAYCDRAGVLLAPHGKTTMAPQIFARQLEAGAWALTAATVQQIHVYREFEVNRILLANQLVGATNLRYICDELAAGFEFEFYSFVDSVEGVETLQQAAREHNLKRPLMVFLEVGFWGGRSGVRNATQVDAVASSIARSGGRVELAGVAGYEGLIPVGPKEAPASDIQLPSVDSYLDLLVDAVERLLSMGLLPHRFFVTAGGSAAFDQVVAKLSNRWPGRAQVVLRSGCYVTHDHGLYQEISPLAKRSQDGPRDVFLQPALQVWSYVQSRPEPDLCLLTFGRRDAGFDHGLPIPIVHVPKGQREARPAEKMQIRELNDQHAYLRVPIDSEIQFGDRVICGISHPCTSMDKWKVIPVVDSQHNIIDAIRTFF